MTEQDLNNKIRQLETRLKTLEANFGKHQHDGLDGTNVLRKNIKLDTDQSLQVGLGSQGSQPVSNLGLSTEQVVYSVSTGKDDGRTGLVNKADLMQMNFIHQPRNTSLQSFLTTMRTPLVSPFEGSSVSVSSGGNTVTISGYSFVTDELAGALINIFDSSGTFVESRTIASNTSTVVTITGTWGATTNGGSFFIYAPVFYGSADTINQRFYTQEGTAGGIRFGVGVTAGSQNQNGLLYMDATGDIYWRNKTGTSTKLN